jgi:hypothetical protein
MEVQSNMGGTKYFEGFAPRLNLTGFTSLPNSFFDDVLKDIDSMAELKIILTIFRKTYGFVSHINEKGEPVYKQQDSISYSQLQEITGLSSPSISSGLTKALEDGFIIKVEQGDYTGKVSAYRVKIKGEDTPPDQGPGPEPKKPEPIKEWPPERYVTMDDFNYTDKNANGLATKDAEPEDDGEFDSPADALEDLFGTKTEEEPKPKKQKSTWKTKDRTKWNCNDLLSYYRDLYESTFHQPFGHITGRERANAKALCDGYGADIVSTVAKWTFSHYTAVQGFPQGPIAFGLFYAWFKTLYNETNGIKTNTIKPDMKGREFNPTKHSDKGDVNSW